MNHRISSAYKLGNNNSSFGVVFFAGLEFRNYINSEFYINENDQFSSLYLQKRQKLPLLSSAFASALIRCNRLLFGGAYTKFDEYETFGVKVGTQFNSFRLVSIIYPSENLTRLQTAELALNIYLR